jgi:hypothetical protein
MIANIVKKVQAELEALGLVAGEYCINEIIVDGGLGCTFDHVNKLVRVGTRAPVVSFLYIDEEPTLQCDVSFIAPMRQAVPSFI